jgi:predicted RNA-binding Zn-ribbon protein involved in translation (DUF1610 family)
MDRRIHALKHAGNVYFSQLELNGEEKRADLRKICMDCGERTVYLCEVCKVPLYMYACNKNFHTQRKLPQMQHPKQNALCPLNAGMGDKRASWYRQ